MAISFALLAAIAIELRSLDVGRILAMIPSSPIFWVAFAASYLAAPISEWIIFRRLWHIPADGILALLRKLVSNELLLGYLGEVQFYGWARMRTAMTNAPFGAIKDVTILSALTGNAVTLAMLLFAWPLLAGTKIGFNSHAAIISLGILLLSSIAILFFRRGLFSLPSAELRWICWMHIFRIAAVLGFSSIMWHEVLPTVHLGWWFLLATLRMLLSRLPLLPNKDVAFAGLAVFLLGHDADIASLMTMMAGLFLVTHIAVGLIAGGLDLMLRRHLL